MTDLTCQQVEALLPAIAGGDAGEHAAAIAAHLAGCAACRQAAAVQVTARAVLRARAAHLSVPAPPGLRTRAEAQLRGSRDRDALGWRGRFSAFAAAALIVMVIGSIALPVLTARSTVLLAAQLALDHLKCFAIDGDAGDAHITKPEAEATLTREYGFTISVPDRNPEEGIRLVAVRRCLYGDGRAAHLLYLVDGTQVSLFIMPGLDRPAAELNVFDHDQIVWNDVHNTYMLVGRSGRRGWLQDVASRLRNEGK
ncbi:MAG: hypothetical protein ABI665_10205 [Vicinamibacterales bacterium]